MSCRYVHCRLGLLNRNASFQFPDRGKPSHIVDAGNQRISLSLDDVNLRRSPAEQIKAGFQDAHNRCRKCVDKHLLAEYVGIAREMALPKLVANQNTAIPWRVGEIGRWNSAEERLDPKQR